MGSFNILRVCELFNSGPKQDFHRITLEIIFSINGIDQLRDK